MDPFPCLFFLTISNPKSLGGFCKYITFILICCLLLYFLGEKGQLHSGKEKIMNEWTKNEQKNCSSLKKKFRKKMVPVILTHCHRN